MCPECGYNICICSKGKKIRRFDENPQRTNTRSEMEQEQPDFSSLRILSNVAVAKLNELNYNTLDTPTYGRSLRIMSWNIERLGDTGGLGKHGGERPQDVIEAIAQIIYKANPYICALIEVFTGAKGISEVNRICGALGKLCETSTAKWAFTFSPGAGTGGLADPDGSNRRDTEGYALLWRTDLGIECVNARWLQIYGRGEIYSINSKGRSYVRDACEFKVKINGKKMFGSRGKDIIFPIAVFHAPGPRADLQRQTLIKDAITSLFAFYASPDGNIDECPNAFICADFNASENADNLVTEEDYRDVNYSFPGDLDYMARLISLVTKIELMRQWIEINKEVKGLEFPVFSIELLKNYLATEGFKKVALGKYPEILNFLEKEVENAESWFAGESRNLNLTGIAKAEKNAKIILNRIMEERLKQNLTNEEFEEDKKRFKLWKTAVDAKTEKKFTEAYWKLDEIEGAEFLLYYLEDEPEIENWQDVQKLVAVAFEEEFEDQQAFLGSRNITTYTNKIVSETMKNVRFLIKNEKKYDIEESYETAFSSGVDTGFFESTSYDETLKTTRRKSILLTGFAKGAKGGKWTADKTASPDSVLYSNYDQVLSRTDGERIDEPRVETIPILDCVLGNNWKQIFKSIYLGCAFKELKIPSQHRFFVKICATANEEYKGILKNLSHKPNFKEKNDTAFRVFKKYQSNTPHCCQLQCATIEDITYLHLLQTYLSRSHAISDHEPVMMSAIFKPYSGFEGWYA